MNLCASRTLIPLSVVSLVACFDPYFQAHDLARDGDQDGVVEEDDCDDDDFFVTFTIYNFDGDLDGYGVPGTPVTGCERPEGYAENDDDCQDEDPNLWFESWWYVDQDLDGFGVGEVTWRCAGYGTSLIDGDCDDARADVNPEAEEVCDGAVDDNCDSLSDCAVVTGEYDEDVFYSTFVGENADLGYQVAAVGDANGDGLGDIVVGAPGATVADADEAGEVALIYGEPPRSWALGTETDGVVMLTGASEGDRVGAVIAGETDLDGDGMDDLAIGVPTTSSGVILGAVGADFPGDGVGDIPGGGVGMGGAGEIYIVYNPVVAGQLALDSMAWAVRLAGEGRDAQSGAALAGLGDINDDGYGDLAIGAPFAADDDDEAGAAYIVLGPVEEDADLSSAAGMAMTGDEAFGRAGWALAMAGDLDGDGVGDLAVGAPTDASEIGAPTVYHDSGKGAVFIVLEPGLGARGLEDASQVVLRGEPSDGFGVFIAGGEDLDGDGTADLVIGAPRSDDEAGAVLLWSGAQIAAGASTGTVSDDARFASISGEAPGDALGTAFDLVPDLDEDGLGELVVGYPARRDGRGALLLYLSPVEGTLSTEVPDLLIAGSTGLGRLGLSVACAGDVNGLGTADLLVGAVPEREDLGSPPQNGTAWLFTTDGM